MQTVMGPSIVSVTLFNQSIGGPCGTDVHWVWGLWHWPLAATATAPAGDTKSSQWTDPAACRCIGQLQINIFFIPDGIGPS